MQAFMHATFTRSQPPHIPGTTTVLFIIRVVQQTTELMNSVWCVGSMGVWGPGGVGLRYYEGGGIISTGSSKTLGLGYSG